MNRAHMEPCPFCSFYEGALLYLSDSVEAYCPSCNVTIDRDTEESAVAAWNERKQPPIDAMELARDRLGADAILGKNSEGQINDSESGRHSQPITVYVSQEGDKLVAECFPFDVVTQADSVPELFERLGAQFAAEIGLAGSIDNIPRRLMWIGEECTYD